MTAEIGIMNSIGVALAADSAVTIGGGTEKIYTSADKLFQLSLTAPVGAMIYGNASLIGIPWETIIKTYRKQLIHEPFDTILEYSDNLIKFLKRRKSIFPRKLEREISKARVIFIYEVILNRIWEILEKKEQSSDVISEATIKEIVHEVVQEYSTVVYKWELPNGLPKNIRQILRKDLGETVRSIKHDMFKKLPMTASISRKLNTLALESLARCPSDSYESGIVIAGFGEKEYAPTLIEIKIDGIIDNRLKYSIGEVRRIDETATSRIIPFAQKEMVYTFMEGIDPDLEDMIHQTTWSLFFGVVKNIIDKVKEHDNKFGKSLEEGLSDAVENLIKNMFREWDNQSQKSHWGPVTEIVSSLPKDELAAMAEALVNLTKFRRRVSKEKETVGGPIDVAVITKGDGFIWVKRKHYFDPKFNPRTMGRYLKEVNI